MCGRFTQYFTWRQLHDLYELTGPALNLEPRYNIAPTTQVLTVRGEKGKRTARMMRWGLIPPWWKEGTLTPLHNARADGVASKPSFRAAFKARRCIVPASGFYEWMTEGKAKRPFYISMADGGIMSLAGLWEMREVDGEEVYSCSIVTTEPNAVMEKIHDRMPVILDRFDFDAWLTARAGEDLLKPCPDRWLTATEVSPYVSNSRNQGERCIEPLASDV